MPSRNSAKRHVPGEEFVAGVEVAEVRQDVGREIACGAVGRAGRHPVPVDRRPGQGLEECLRAGIGEATTMTVAQLIDTAEEFRDCQPGRGGVDARRQALDAEFRVPDHVLLAWPDRCVAGGLRGGPRARCHLDLPAQRGDMRMLPVEDPRRGRVPRHCSASVAPTRGRPRGVRSELVMSVILPSSAPDGQGHHDGEIERVQPWCSLQA